MKKENPDRIIGVILYPTGFRDGGLKFIIKKPEENKSQ
jgi:hypothetical protein